MSFAIHEEALKKQSQWIISRPQEMVPEEVPQNFGGTMGQGLPVKQIPHYEFPIVLYKHPNKPYRTIEHKNDKFEVVSTEVIPTEHLVKKFSCSLHAEVGPAGCDKCQAVLKVALEEGWVKEPYVPKTAPKPDDDLYETRKKKQA